MTLFRRNICLWHSCAAPDLGSGARGVISERWFDGIWLGVQFTSGEHIVATSDGRVIRARAVHPRPETVKITRESVNNLKVGPWNPSEVITQYSAGKPAPMVEETQPSQAGEPVPRSLRITEELLHRFNYTKGCPKCDAMKKGRSPQDCALQHCVSTTSR